VLVGRAPVFIDRPGHVGAPVDAIGDPVSVAVRADLGNGVERARGLDTSNRLGGSRGAQSHLKADADAQNLGIVVVVAIAIDLKDLQVTNEGANPKDALFADGKRKAGAHVEARTIERTGPNVQRVDVDPR
jgi:hypothetical protein